MGEIQIYAPKSIDFNLLIVLTNFVTYLIYEVGKGISENNDDDDMDGSMMRRATEGVQGVQA